MIDKNTKSMQLCVTATHEAKTTFSAAPGGYKAARLSTALLWEALVSSSVRNRINLLPPAAPLRCISPNVPPALFVVGILQF